jgi:hypothetical protein
LRITADTNILVRAAVADDPDLAKQAMDLLRDGEIMVLTLPMLYEFVWVLAGGYRRPAADIAAPCGGSRPPRGYRSVARPSTRGSPCSKRGNFADGVTAFDGRRLGGAVFARHLLPTA